MRYSLICTILLFLSGSCLAQRTACISGSIRSAQKGEKIESASIINNASGLWTLSDEQGNFRLAGLPLGTTELEIHIIGYRTRYQVLQLQGDSSHIEILLDEDNLKLNEVSITAQRNRGSETTSYEIDRKALDHLQMLNVSDAIALLPGGKSDGDESLMSDPRLALRSQGSLEMGNTSFGTAIEMDGIRLSNNSQFTLSGSSTRTLPASNIEKVEIITGIPSVEYGDLSNGIVRVHSRQGKLPWTVEGTVKPHTRLIALSKGWNLSHRNRQAGTLNLNLERAKSFSNLTSPYTSYDRNTLSLSYSHRLGQRHPLLLTANVSGNYGGYNSKSDPDNYLDTHTKVRDYVLRTQLRLQWQLNLPGITSVEVSGSGSWSDKKSEAVSYTSTASSQVQIHATQQGYYVGAEYDENPQAEILLSPIGYWYRTLYTDNKPTTKALHFKYQWNTRLHEQWQSQLKAGADFQNESNHGRGSYYKEMRTAPTWREDRYDTLPSLNSLSAYAEEHLIFPFRSTGRLSLTAGLRSDWAIIDGTEYGTVSALSPRMSGRLQLWNDDRLLLSTLSLHGGVGKSVKLPSFEVLYPSTTYSDQLAFAPGTMADGRTFYAYYCIPSKALYNEKLKWQYSRQIELGTEATLGGHRISLSFYRTRTYRPYLSTYVYTPYTYKYTGQAQLEGCNIVSANRAYVIDRETGIVTVSDRTGTLPDEELGYVNRNTYKYNVKYVNGSSSMRQGLEWVIDFASIRPLNTEIRWDGNATYYKGVEHTLMQSRPSSTATTAQGEPYPYIGYYYGSTTVGNGSTTRQLNTNVTVTTHIPAVRLILSVRLESTLCRYSRNLESNGIIPESISSYEGTESKQLSGEYVMVYPKYYSTWEHPEELIPFKEALRDAKENDTALYNELKRLINRSNSSYYFRGNRISPYLAGHLNVTKEIGDHIQLSFQATNFWNNTRKVHTSQTDSEITLYGSGYIQSFYYGLSLQWKI